MNWFWKSSSKTLTEYTKTLKEYRAAKDLQDNEVQHSAIYITESPMVVDRLASLKLGPGEEMKPQDVLRRFRHLPALVVTLKERKGFYTKIIPECLIYEEFDDKLLMHIFERQKCLREKKDSLLNGLVLVLDKCTFPDRAFVKLMNNHRCNNIIVCISDCFIVRS